SPASGLPLENHMRQPIRLATLVAGMLFSVAAIAQSPASSVNPLIGSSNGGKHNRTAAPGGYLYSATRIRGFSLTHLSGTGCAGASGDVPFMPVTSAITTSPSADDDDSRYASDFSHADEHAEAGYYQVKLANGTDVQLSAAMHSGIARFAFPVGRPANLLIRSSDSEVGSSAADVHVDRANRSVTGSVTSGNFCGYLAKADQRSYYTLY